MNITKRGFLRTIGVLGGGAIGLMRFIRKVYGVEPDGVPLVHTRDLSGAPEQVRVIPRERYRRIQVFKNYPFKTLERGSNKVRRVDLVRKSVNPSDLELEISVATDAQTARKRFPNQIKSIPVNIVQQTFEREKHQCGSHNPLDPIKGGAGISGADYGTLTMVGYNSNGANMALITEDHVMKGSSTMSQGGRKIGDFGERDPANGGQGEDVTKYLLDIQRDFSVDTYGTYVPSVPDITGTWDWQGVYDITENNSTIPCDAPTANVCQRTNEANHAGRHGIVNHQIDMAYEYSEGGDSGAPWVDENGKLVAIHSGEEETLFPPDTWDCGVAGTEALSAVNAY